MNSPHVLRKLLYGGLGLLLICAPGGAVWAQDAQYWTNQYGNRARLLAGAVIGSSTDLAAVYYNPGALSLLENPELLLSANVFQYTHYNLQLADSEMTDLSSSQVGGAPSLFAGEIKFGFLGKMRFGCFQDIGSRSLPVSSRILPVHLPSLIVCSYGCPLPQNRAAIVSA